MASGIAVAVVINRWTALGWLTVTLTLSEEKFNYLSQSLSVCKEKSVVRSQIYCNCNTVRDKKGELHDQSKWLCVNYLYKEGEGKQLQ